MMHPSLKVIGDATTRADGDARKRGQGIGMGLLLDAGVGTSWSNQSGVTFISICIRRSYPRPAVPESSSATSSGCRQVRSARAA